MPRIIRWWDKHQASLYLAATALGASAGFAVPQLAPDLERSIEPTLILLLFATFLGIPLIEVGRAFRDIRFLGTVLITNFAIIAAIAFGLSRFVADDRGLLLGVLLVLLIPCIDYVIVFTGLPGGRPPGCLQPHPCSCWYRFSCCLSTCSSSPAVKSSA